MRRHRPALVVGLLVLGCLGLSSCAVIRDRLWPTSSPTSATSADRLTPAEAAVFGPDVSARTSGAFGASRTHLVETGAKPAVALRVSFPKGSVSPTSARDHGTPGGGAQAYLPLRRGGVDSLWLHYAVRFEPGFEFAKGGKLPGLYGGTMTSGGRIPDGTNGLSTRIVWRRGGAGEVYAYLPTSVTYGTSLGRGNFTFPTGVWVTLDEHVVLNRPGHDDGSIGLWVDGHQVITAEHLTFRTTSKLAIHGIYFCTFFGGNDPSWASPRDQYADFADFAVSSQRPRSLGA